MTTAQTFLLVISILLVSSLLFLGMWYGVVQLLSRVSGWSRLAKQYTATQVYEGPVVTTYAHARWVHYRGILRVGANVHALHLSVFALFRMGHPPLCIPWSAIKLSTPTSFMTQFLRVEVDEVRIDLHRNSLSKLEQKQELPEALKSALAN